MVSLVLIEPIRTLRAARVIHSVQESFIGSISWVADLAESCILRTNCTFLIAGITGMVGIVLIEAVRTDWHARRTYCVQEGFKSALWSTLLTIRWRKIAKGAFGVTSITYVVCVVLVVTVRTCRKTRRVRLQ